MVAGMFSARGALVPLAVALAPSSASSVPSVGFADEAVFAMHGLDGAWAALLSAGAEAASAAPGRGPYVAPAFKADVVGQSASAFGAQRGTYFRDTHKQRWRMTQCGEQTIFKPRQFFCMDQLAVNITGLKPGYNMNNTVGHGPNAVCKVFPTPYSDMLASLAVTKHVGSSSVAGEPCEVWAASISSSGYSSNISACIAADGVPRQYNVTSNIAYKAAAQQFLTFSNVSVGDVPDEAFRPSEACQERWPTPPCQQSGVAPLTLYRVRSPKEPNSLENRNLGDALGDMAFFCDISGLDETQVVTSWSVQANSSWGQYAYCLYGNGKNTCYSGTGTHVGRESALGLGEGPVQGQCSDNGDVGSWFSIPSEGHCPEGAPIGQSGCTWSARALRTVSARCILEERGLKASCARERGHAPMLRSAAIFRAALASADPARGGCPEVGEVVVMV